MDNTISKQIDQAKNIFVLTGSGISVASGIQTYRGKDGQHEIEFQGRKASGISHIKILKSNPKLFWQFQKSRLYMLEVQPNAGHYACVSLEKYCQRKNKNFILVTQNIDEPFEKSLSDLIINENPL